MAVQVEVCLLWRRIRRPTLRRHNSRSRRNQETSLWNQERLRVVFPKRLGSSSADQGQGTDGRFRGQWSSSGGGQQGGRSLLHFFYILAIVSI